MPIPQDQINRDWIEFPASVTLGEIQQSVPRDERRRRWIVTPVADNQYAVYRVSDLLEFMRGTLNIGMMTDPLLNRTLAELGNFLETFARAPVEVSARWQDVREAWSPLTDPPLAVTENGVLIGILKSERRGGGGDVDWFDQIAKSANGGTKAAPPPAAPPLGNLEAGAVETPARPTRFINARFDDHDPQEPLQVGEVYTLVFSVDLERLADSLGDKPAIVDENKWFAPDVEQVEMTIQLLSDDFNILTEPQKLIVPRTGKSKNKARFDIEPQRNGVGEITAVFLREGNAVQSMTLRLNVGLAGQPGVLGTETLGRPIDAGAAVKPRELTLWIQYTGSGFRVNVIGSGFLSANIPLTTDELKEIIADARNALLDIVNYQKNGDAVYQADIDIPADVNREVLPKLAEAGFDLFRRVFLHPGIDQNGFALVKYLRDQAQKEMLNIQIVSQEMMLPWGMLYMADRFDPNNVKPELFLGFKHIIEHIPMQPNMDFPRNIPSQPKLAVSLNLNREIDRDMQFPLIKNQETFWQGVQAQTGITVITRTTRSALLDALADTTTPDQILYFYGHAVSRDLAERVTVNRSEVEKNPEDSILKLGEQQVVTLKDLNRSAPLDIRLASAPLVFINACESAELSPLFYNGFMPYFVGKGARGMIGTECSMPALFAAEWAQKFFELFLKGKSIGESFLQLRREYFFNHNNPLGLLYAVYCDADTCIEPALQ
jgi:hypothetical protein